MNFSYSKQTLLRPQKEKYLLTFFIALTVAAALFVPYMIMGEGYSPFTAILTCSRFRFTCSATRR